MSFGRNLMLCLLAALTAVAPHCRADLADDLLTEAATAAAQVADPQERAIVLADIALARSAADPGLAERLIGEAIVAADQVEEPAGKVLAQRGVAVRAWAWQPERGRAMVSQAAEAARGLAYSAQKAMALREIARDVASLDGDLSRSLLAEAATIARTIPAAVVRIAALRDLGEAAIAFAPQLADEYLGEALRQAGMALSPGPTTDMVRADLAVALAALDPAAALSQAAKVADPAVRDGGLLRLAEALAPVDADTAVAAAQQVSDRLQQALGIGLVASRLPLERAEAAASLGRTALIRGGEGPAADQEPLLAAVAIAMVRARSGEALLVLREIQDPDILASATTEVAARLAIAQPREALALALEIGDWREREEAVRRVAPLMPPARLDEALQVVRKLRSPRLRALALLDLSHLAQADGE